MKKIIISAIIIIVLITTSILFYFIDSQRFLNNRKPLFILKTVNYSEGGTSFYYGLGYQFIDWNILGFDEGGNSSFYYVGKEVNVFPFIRYGYNYNKINKNSLRKVMIIKKTNNTKDSDTINIIEKISEKNNGKIINIENNSEQKGSPESSNDKTSTALKNTKIFLSDQQHDDCNFPMNFIDKENFMKSHARIREDGSIIFWGDAYVSVDVSEYRDKNFEIRWYKGATNPLIFNNEIPSSTEWVIHSLIKNIKPIESCGGKLFIHTTTPSLESGFGAEGTALGARKFEFWIDGKMLEDSIFYFQQ